MAQNPTSATKKKVETTAQRLNSLIKSCRDIMRKDRGLSSDVDRLPQLTWLMFLKFLDDSFVYVFRLLKNKNYLI